jgi:hypothetical protein
MDGSPARRAHGDSARGFVEEVLRTGIVLTDLLSGLLEDLSEDAFGDEDSGEVLIEMLTGSVRPALDAAGPGAVREATMLLAAVRDRTLSDLRAALERARPG